MLTSDGLTIRAMLSVAMLLGLGCTVDPDAANPIELPPELAGRYETSDPRYVDRYFELSPDTVTLGLGDGLSTSHDVQQVFQEGRRDRMLYTIVYSTPEGPDRLRMLQTSADELVMKNQPGIRWQRRRRDR